MKKAIIAATVAGLALAAFSPSHAQAQKSAPGPHVIVYKTKKDYHNLVPVILSDDKKTIVSYPDPADVQLASVQPVALHKGYWLDKKGIGKNVAFLKWTYAQYAKLKKVPSAQELYNNITDKDPLTEYYDCGTRGQYKNTKAAMNALIDKKQLGKSCKDIKKN
jgi:hypothetical protein